MHKELLERLANEYKYAATKMQESSNTVQKLYYFSVLFGEASRVLNFEWDRDVSLIHLVTQQTHNQIMGALSQNLPSGSLLEWPKIIDILNQTAFDLAAYLGKSEDKGDKKKLCEILGRISEISYVVSGNGTYLYDKGLIKL